MPIRRKLIKIGDLRQARNGDDAALIRLRFPHFEVAVLIKRHIADSGEVLSGAESSLGPQCAQLAIQMIALHVPLKGKQWSGSGRLALWADNSVGQNENVLRGDEIGRVYFQIMNFRKLWLQNLGGRVAPQIQDYDFVLG